MALKSLKANITVQATSLEDAIVFLSQRFLRLTKTGCRVVQTPTDICAADVCQPLIEGWMSGRVAYGKGKIALVFRSGELGRDADMLIFTPKDGDRFLYTRPRSQMADGPSPSMATDDLAPDPRVLGQPTDRQRPSAARSNALEGVSLSQGVTSALQDLPALVAQIQSLDAKVESLVVAHSALSAASSSSADGALSSTQQPSTQQPSTPPVSVQQVQGGDSFQAFASVLLRQVKQQVHTTVSQQTAQVLHGALDPVLQQLDDLQDQIETLTDYVAELDIADFATAPPVPQTNEEWLERINANWGTVGDYEKYSQSYRDANAEAPLQETPDWVALCEFDWVWALCPPLQTLYQLIRGTGGIGDDGADILQQFGQHIDAKTGDPYYLYQLGGYSAAEALRQIAYGADHSWLPELKRLWAALGSPAHPIFQLFGWEADAIAALEHIVSAGYSQATQSQASQQQSSYRYQGGTSTNPASSPQPSLRDYQSMLSLGPFTPITVETIRRAYRQAMKAAHPDAGGSTEYAQQVNEAYAAVMTHYFPEDSSPMG